MSAYACPLCPKTTKTTAGLFRHLDTHEGVSTDE